MLTAYSLVSKLVLTSTMLPFVMSRMTVVLADSAVVFSLHIWEQNEYIFITCHSPWSCVLEPVKHITVVVTNEHFDQHRLREGRNKK